MELTALENKNLRNVDFEYSNENGIFNFLETIESLLQNNLVDFGKTNEKPLAKTLNILKSSTAINEFYPQEKKSNLLATDMLTRSFYYYYYSQKRFRKTLLETLKDFIFLQLDDQLPFFITRIFTTHLKKVRFDEYYTAQCQLFDIIKLIINSMPQNEWIDFQEILNQCKDRDIRFDFESRYKTGDYYMVGDTITQEGTQSGNIYAYYEYQNIFFEPILKASFFYLAALGILEIKYNKPVTPCNMNLAGLPYISVWDQLKYIKLTQLGLYILGINDEYTIKQIEQKESTLKFDQFKPIITIDSQDTLMLSKLEPYTIHYEDNKYILNYNKIFKDCNTYKSLKLKINGFYKNIVSKPPQVFIEFFNTILENANMLQKDIEQIVINLKNNKKLLNLFMTNKKLQDITIKAQGYKIIVSKNNLLKLTRIIKDNGFFIEF